MANRSLADGSRTLSTIPDLACAFGIGQARGVRSQVAPLAAGVAAAPLIKGTEWFADSALVAWHSGRPAVQKRDLACYMISDATVTGAGQLWVDGSLVTSPEIMPPYVAQALNVAGGGADALHYCAGLPERVISTPCLVAVGPGTDTYGHFLVEMLFRILIARRVWPTQGKMPYKVLLDAATPGWLLRILADDLDVNSSDIETFDPWHEKIHLKQAIVPTRVFLDPLIHPFTNQLIDELIVSMHLSARLDLPQNVFVARDRCSVAGAARRVCVNESELAELASSKHAFAVVRPEKLTWREQIALFHHARVLIGLSGSALHNAIFCQPGSRVGSIGFINPIQSEIGALRGQSNAYLARGFELRDDFTVQPELFEAFLQAMCL